MSKQTFEDLAGSAQRISMTAHEKASMRKFLDDTISTTALITENQPKYLLKERRSKPRFSVRTFIYEWNPITIIIDAGTKLFDSMKG